MSKNSFNKPAIMRSYLRLGVYLMIGCIPCAAMAADDPTQPPNAQNWIKLETYLQDHGKSESKARKQAPLLPSLQDDQAQKAAPAAAEAETAAPAFGTAAMPPMFERRKPAPPFKKPSPPASSPNVVVAPPIPPQQPLPPVCAPDAKQAAKNAERDSALAKDRATLDALRNAVKDLRLEQQLPFLSAPAKTNAPPEPAAQSNPENPVKP